MSPTEIVILIMFLLAFGPATIELLVKAIATVIAIAITYRRR